MATLKASTIRESGVRCPNPDCGARVGDDMIGYYRTTCHRCHGPIVIVRAAQSIIELNDVRVIVNVRIEDKAPQ